MGTVSLDQLIVFGVLFLLITSSNLLLLPSLQFNANVLLAVQSALQTRAIGGVVLQETAYRLPEAIFVSLINEFTDSVQPVNRKKMKRERKKKTIFCRLFISSKSTDVMISFLPSSPFQKRKRYWLAFAALFGVVASALGHRKCLAVECHFLERIEQLSCEHWRENGKEKLRTAR